MTFDTSHLNVQYIAIRQFKSEYAMYIAIRQFKSLCILTYANLNLNMLNISPFSNVEATFAEIPGVLETGTIRKIDRRYPFNDACQVSHKSNHYRVGRNMSFCAYKLGLIGGRYPFNDACQVTVTKVTIRVGRNTSFAHICKLGPIGGRYPFNYACQVSHKSNH